MKRVKRESLSLQRNWVKSRDLKLAQKKSSKAKKVQKTPLPWCSSQRAVRVHFNRSSQTKGRPAISGLN